MSNTATITSAPSTMKPSKGPLRRRMHLLHRAHSLTNLGSTNMTHSKKKLQQDGEEDDTSPLDYETFSDSSASEQKTNGSPNWSRAQTPQSKTAPPTRPRVNTTFTSPFAEFRQERSPLSPNSRSWYEFDLAVVVALVSPVGNWLTGGDHIKNLLLVVLLIFYLHQIIEIPWSLYQKARPRRRSPQFPPDPSERPEVRYADLAAAELRRLELFFLFCTLVSPICGALLLRYATAAVLGPDAVSWFSTGLFVLATGMRPWAHLVDRLNERTVELHDFIHYPETISPQAKQELSQEVEGRLAKLEETVTKFKMNVEHATEEVYEYVDDTVETLEHNMMKQNKRLEKSEDKVIHVEKALATLQYRPFPCHFQSLFNFSWAKRTVYAYTRWIPLTGWILTVIFPRPIVKKPALASPSRMTPRGHPHSAASSLARPSRLSTRLEPIDEEGVVYESYPLLIRPVIFASAMVSRFVAFVLLPLRAVVRMVLRRY